MTSKMKSTVYALLAGTLAGFAIYVYQDLEPGSLLGIDGYFHVKLSALIAERGLIEDFTWLPHTIYATGFVDDRLLFHLLLIPFTTWDLIAGARIYTSLVGGGVFALFYLLLSRHGVSRPMLWTLALFVSCHPFLYRLCLARAPGLSLLFLLAGCWLLLDGRDRWLAPLALAYTWSYGAFPLILVQTVAACVAFQIAATPRWRALGWVSAGCVAGLVLNPYFPDNLEFLWHSYTEIELGSFPHHLLAGTEDYPFAASTAVRKAWLVWAVVFLAVLAYLVRPIQLTATSLYLFLFSTALLCLYLLARRFIEYWPPFAFLFAALALERWWLAAPARWKAYLRRVLWVSVPCILLIAGSLNGLAWVGNRKTERHPDQYAGASTYLQKTVPRGDLVFHASWADFPLLFFHNHENRYIVGLGLHYLYLQDESLYADYVAVCEGDKSSPSATIVDRFGARYAFARKKDSAFVSALDRDPGAVTVYEDDYATVWRLSPNR